MVPSGPVMLVVPAWAEPVTRPGVPGRVPSVVGAQARPAADVPAATATATVIVHAATLSVSAVTWNDRYRRRHRPSRLPH